MAMLSGVLRTPRAIRVNIEIMRAFVRLRRILTAHPDLARRIQELEGTVDEKFQIVFDALRMLTDPERSNRRRMIGFRTASSVGSPADESRSKAPLPVPRKRIRSRRG
jgi:hypothetical protein